MVGSFTLDMFDYELAAGSVAHSPVSPRHESKLLLLPGDPTLSPEHHRFDAVPSLLRRGDLLVVNRSRVIPARLRVTKETGGKVELLLFRPLGAGLREATRWLALGKPASALRPGRVLRGPDGASLTVEHRGQDGLTISSTKPLWPMLEAHGEVPLPPYINRPQGPQRGDRTDYQTVFADEPGAVAAPTASLHFTPTVLEGLGRAGVNLATVLLHVGPGTFLPVREEHAADVRSHPMHEEYYQVPVETQRAMASTRAAGGRVVAVGTTAVRALESEHFTGETSGLTKLFIYPGFEFGAVDGMITNFHLPRSTLLMLVAAFSGRERVLDAYALAQRAGYRFFSYGDAMLLWRS